MKRAVLFDVGGPIDTEIAWEAAMDGVIRRVVGRALGRAVTDGEYAAAWRAAVDGFAPNAYQAVVWRLLDGDAERAPLISAPLVWARIAAAARLERGPPELRPGMAALLFALQAQGVRLALAANQPVEMLRALEEAGLLHLFAVHGLSGVIELRKPDPRFFLHIVEALGRQVEECVMVGDRIDNDIAPARALGMGTVLLRTGRHAGQRARSWLETADVVVEDVEGLRVGLAGLLG